MITATTSRLRRASAIGAVVVAVLAAGAAPATAKSSSGGAKALVGVFTVDRGEQGTGATPTGSWFRMVSPGGTPAAGPYVPNVDSLGTDKSYTLLVAGTGRGLATGKYQPEPKAAFDDKGNGVASAILAPTKFFGIAFAVSTNATDPQAGTATHKPKITVKNGKLSGDLDAFGVAYSGQHFNQGSPKPDGSRPTGTLVLTGTYDAKTGRYTLDWSSTIVGGPFDKFTGVWHLEGTFSKKAR